MSMTRTSGGLAATLATSLVLLASCSDDSADGAATEAEAATPPSSASAPTSADPEAGPESATPLRDLAAETRLAPGRYVMDVSGEQPDQPSVLIDVPAGYQTRGDAYEISADDEGGFRHLDTWTVAEVATRPCADDPGWGDPGPGVDDLAEALAALPVWESTRPVMRTVGGHDAAFLELNVPERLPARCGEAPQGWRDHVGSTQGVSSGKTQLLWIVDVDGRRVVLVAGYFPGPEGPSARQVRELTGMVEGATFVEATDD